MPDLPEELKVFLETNKEYFYYGAISEGWVSILNESLSWENVKDVAMTLSKHLEATLLSVGYFDDSIFELNIIKKQKLLTTHISGSDVQVYGKNLLLGNTEIFIKELGIVIDKLELKQILEINNIEDKLSKLEKILNIPIWIDGEWLKEEEYDGLKNKLEKIECI
jgi:hypothetical protein